MSSRSPELVISGIGMITPAGCDSAASWHTVCAGLPAGARAARLAGQRVDFACTVPADFDEHAVIGAEARRMARFTQFTVAAARQAVHEAGLGPGSWDAARVGVVVGTAFGGIDVWQEQAYRLRERGNLWMSPLTVPLGLANMAAGAVVMDLGLHGPSLAVSTACASGTTAIGAAMELVASGRCDIVLAGGAEAPVTPLVAAGFDRLQALSRRTGDPAAASRPFDRDRDGFVLGEGAAMLVLERRQDALARHTRPHARLLGYGAATDAHHLTDPEPDGRFAEQAVRSALRRADVSPNDVGLVHAHATSTPGGDAVEARLIRRIYRHGPPVTASKGVTGHLLGAAGALQAAMAAFSLEHGVIPPTANLHSPDPDVDMDIVTGHAGRANSSVAVSHSFGFGGHNAVAVLARI
ncbi:beta-ketoacyl-[acyl-carrier-protein] synthase family protein [Streptomyces sp. NPDC007205]|uniref:beta-ketoacyl-[acyl-carrier-protein] synthase family protein n=1 Tax=Streptomyces sp. NPDC007205 TaxID=3154316 RepID=UPI0033D7C029